MLGLARPRHFSIACAWRGMRGRSASSVGWRPTSRRRREPIAAPGCRRPRPSPELSPVDRRGLVWRMPRDPRPADAYGKAAAGSQQQDVSPGPPRPIQADPDATRTAGGHRERSASRARRNKRRRPPGNAPWPWGDTHRASAGPHAPGGRRALLRPAGPPAAAGNRTVTPARSPFWDSSCLAPTRPQNWVSKWASYSARRSCRDHCLCLRIHHGVLGATRRAVRTDRHHPHFSAPRPRPGARG